MRINSGTLIYQDPVRYYVGSSLATVIRVGTGNLEVNAFNQVSVSRPIIGDLVAHAGFDSEVSTATRNWAGFAQVALTYRIVDDVEFFVGSSFGVAGDPTAPDYNPFVGINARF